MAKQKLDDTGKLVAEIQSQFPDLYEVACEAARSNAIYDSRPVTRRDELLDIQHSLFLYARDAADLGVRLYACIRAEPKN